MVGALRMEKIILWPPDPGRQRQLERKAEEYLERILDPRLVQNLQCYRNRVLILVLILVQGGVTYRQARELAVCDTDFDEAEFVEDFYIIEDYCLTGGANNGLGTGLPYGQTGSYGAGC
jgi:hypothetical protein